MEFGIGGTPKFDLESWFTKALGIRGDYTFSWWVILLFAFPSYAINVFYDATRNGGTPIEWVPVALGSYLMTVLAFLGAKYVKFKFLPQAGTLYALFCYPLIGLVRGITAYILSVELHLVTASDLPYRLVSAPLVGLSLFVVFAALVSTVSMQQEAFDSLALERASLRSAIKNFRQLHQRLREDVLTRVSGIVYPVIAELRLKLQRATVTSDLAPALASLQVTVDDVIRPLSHEIASEEMQLELDTTGPIQVVRRASLPKTLQIELMSVWGGILTVLGEFAPQALARPILDALLTSVFAGLTFFVLLKFLESFVGKRQLNPVGAFVFFVGSYTAAGYLAPLFWLRTGWHLHYNERTGFLALTALMGVVLYVMELARGYRQEALRELQQVNTDMALLTSQLRQQVWLDRRRVALVLHGSVQGALYAAAIKLSRETAPTSELIREVEKDIAAALGELTKVQGQAVDFEAVLDDIVALWEDTIDFRIDLDPKALAILNGNADTAESTIEVLREAVNNAVKHGGTDEVAIKVMADKNGLITLRVDNTGAGVKTELNRGYGSSILDELTHQWSLKNTETGVELQAQIVA